MKFQAPTAAEIAAAEREAKRNMRRFMMGTAGPCAICGKAVSNTQAIMVAVDPATREAVAKGGERDAADWVVVGANCAKSHELKTKFECCW